MFRWQFLPPDCRPSASAGPPSLEATQFESSAYDAPATIYELERQARERGGGWRVRDDLRGRGLIPFSPQSKKGHMLLTNAVRTGRTCVQAHLTQPLTQVRRRFLLFFLPVLTPTPHPPPSFQDAELQAEVVLTVVERLDLLPPLVYIIPEQTITYSIRRNLGQPVAARRDSVPYSLSVDNRTVAVPAPDDGTVQGQKIGSTAVRLVDNGVLGKGGREVEERREHP